MKKNVKNYTTIENSKELAKALGIHSSVDQMLMEYKAELSSMAVKAIHSSGYSVNEIVVNSGIARSKVSAIKNGAISGMSCDLFIKIIAATGKKLSLKVAG